MCTYQGANISFTHLTEGDRVIVQGRNPLLTKPLRPGKRTEVSRGVLEHNDIIGKRARDLIKAHKGNEPGVLFQENSITSDSNFNRQRAPTEFSYARGICLLHPPTSHTGAHLISHLVGKWAQTHVTDLRY